MDPSEQGKELSASQFGKLRKFLSKKFPQNFNIIWSSVLQFKARTGHFAQQHMWDDANIVDALTWWKCYGHDESNKESLQNLACKLLSMPTSSAASERCWSTMGHIHDSTRNRLTDDRVEMLTYIYFNERMFKKL